MDRNIKRENRFPLRGQHPQTPEGQAVRAILARREREGYESYWERFGYELGGPVCCGYVQWLAKRISELDGVTGIAFVARDGWLLKQIYERYFPNAGIASHYVYAPRSVCLRYREAGAAEDYRGYLRAMPFGRGTVAVVDSVTMKFSAQRLLASALGRDTFGLYWVVLNGSRRYGGDFSFAAFQAGRYHRIRCWNLMEYIMSSPEPPVRAMEGGKPLYREAAEGERIREQRFLEIERGALAFSRDLFSMREPPTLECAFLTEWVNGFLAHPRLEDVRAFSDVYVSEREDHSDSVPLDPFGRTRPILSSKKLKDALWLYSQGRPALYRILHCGKQLYLRMQGALRVLGGQSYRGGHPAELAQRLSSYPLVSFDIFDTLIRRPYRSPEGLFDGLAVENGIRDFHALRVRAEQEARRSCGGGNGEVTIFDIYRTLCGQTNPEAGAMALREIEAEKRVCYADPDMYEVYRLLYEKGVRMIAVSDMYLPARFLRELLDSCGYEGIREIYVSCEYGVGKTGGALQRRVREELAAEAQPVHIGDNLESDVKGSIAAGWKAIWYRRGKQGG